MDAEMALEFQSGDPDIAKVHSGDELKDAAFGSARKTVEDVLPQVDSERSRALSVMDRAFAVEFIAALAEPVPTELRGLDSQSSSPQFG
jgi:hypothetical protein